MSTDLAQQLVKAKEYKQAQRFDDAIAILRSVIDSKESTLVFCILLFLSPLFHPTTTVLCATGGLTSLRQRMIRETHPLCLLC